MSEGCSCILVLFRRPSLIPTFREAIMSAFLPQVSEGGSPSWEQLTLPWAAAQPAHDGQEHLDSDYFCSRKCFLTFHFFLMEIASGHLSHTSSNMQMEENLVTNLVKHNVPGHELLPWCKFGDDHQFFLKRQSERVLGCEHWTPVFLWNVAKTSKKLLCCEGDFALATSPCDLAFSATCRYPPRFSPL